MECTVTFYRKKHYPPKKGRRYFFCPEVGAKRIRRFYMSYARN